MKKLATIFVASLLAAGAAWAQTDMPQVDAHFDLQEKHIKQGRNNHKISDKEYEELLASGRKIRDMEGRMRVKNGQGSVIKSDRVKLTTELEKRDRQIDRLLHN